MSGQTQQPYFVWDTCDILQYQAAFLVESSEAENEEQAWAMASDDQDLFTFEWESLVESLTEKLDELNPDAYWYCEVNNFGWRNQSGWCRFNGNEGRAFLSHILPETDCTFRIFIDDDNTIRIQNFHHDSPTGNEWYTITVDVEACSQNDIAA